MRRDTEFRYMYLAGILREQIMSGFIKPGQYLLSENELCHYYEMSRTSVRKALEELLKEGLIIKKVGQGTMVAPNLAVKKLNSKVLRILAISPSHFMEIGMPIVIEEFQKKYPNVEVKFLSLPDSSFWESVEAIRQSGLQVDIILGTDREFNDMDEDGPFLNLDDPLGDIMSNLYQPLRRAFTKGDSLIVLPVTFSPVFLSYNPQLFSKYNVSLPRHDWTREDFLRAAQLLTLDTDSDGITDQYGLALSSSLNRWPQIALQNGASFRQDANAESFVRSLTFIHDLLYRYRIATLPPRYRTNSEAFIKEKAAMVLTTFIELAGWRHEQMPFDPQIAPMPFGEQQASILIANVMMIPEYCADQELAVSFLRTAVSPEIQEKISRQKHFLSVLPSVNSMIFDKDQLSSINIVGDSIPGGTFLHELFADRNVAEEIESEMYLYWGGLESASHFAHRLIQMLHASRA